MYVLPHPQYTKHFNLTSQGGQSLKYLKFQILGAGGGFHPPGPQQPNCPKLCMPPAATRAGAQGDCNDQADRWRREGGTAKQLAERHVAPRPSLHRCVANDPQPATPASNPRWTFIHYLTHGKCGIHPRATCPPKASVCKGRC